MKKFFLFCCLMVSALFAVSQTKVSFTGVSINGSYCPFDRVNVTNVTRGWTETLLYPDTVIILSGLGVEEFSSSHEGITRVYPNPFEDFTNVEFVVFESGQVDIRVVGVDGVLKASWEGYMQQGIHQVRITLDKPQMAFVVVTTEKERYVGKLLHVGENGINEIDVCSASLVISERSSGSSRSGESGDFRPGDMMSYEGVLLNCGGEVYSDKVIQEQFGDEIISLAFPEIVPGGEVRNLPYCQTFESEFGTYTTYDVMGLQTWEIDYNTAKMTGFVNSTYNANEDWLISSPVAITGVDDAKMTIRYIARYFNNIDNDVTIWASADYDCSSGPMAATWTQLPVTLTQANNWNEFQTDEISLSQFVGQIVTCALKYTSSDSNAGTIEIQSICIEEGTAGGGPTPPGPGMGSGTADDPYNVAAGIELQNESPVAWVQGYIVGAVKSGLTSVSSNDDINWNPPFDLVTNVLIADDAACHEISQCIIVNLPAGKPMRTAVNLVDHPENLGKRLSALGTPRRYFAQAGLRDCSGNESDFVLEGGDTPPTPSATIFSETFASGQGQFTIQDVVMPSELTYIWQHAPSYSCMKASAYVGQAYAAESWLVSPSIDLSGVSVATLNFEQAVNYASPQGALKVMISTNYNGDVTTAAWNELNIDQWPTGNNWTFINSTADLTNYVDQTVTIAFKYTSTTSASATWEVKNFVVE